MKVHKIGHSCLIIEDGDVRVLTDPGNFSDGQNAVSGLSAICITHKHADHCDINSIQQIRENNPDAQIITNADVGAELERADVPYTAVANGGEVSVGDMHIQVVGKNHAFIYEGMEEVENTGFIFNGILYHPGDAHLVPEQAISLLALPIMAPWEKISEALDFAKAVNPKTCFPIHDGILAFPGPFQKLPERFLPEAGIDFHYLIAGEDISVD